MGLRDILTGRHQVKGPAPDRLFAITTAYVTLETEHQIVPAGKAAIVFQALATSEFESTIKDMEEVVQATGGESATTRRPTQDDDYGYRWMILRNPPARRASKTSPSAINAVAGSIETAGYGERLLCAVFAFEDRSGTAGRPAGAPVYFIYNYKRGFWYPFVPDGGRRAALHRARAAAEGPDAERTADRARNRALVPALGDPDLAALRGRRPPTQSGIRPSPVKSSAASSKVTSAGGRITSEASSSSSPARAWPCVAHELAAAWRRRP